MVFYHRDMGLFQGSDSVRLIYVSLLMPVPDYFDYRGLILKFDIRYYDPFDLAIPRLGVYPKKPETPI